MTRTLTYTRLPNGRRAISCIALPYTEFRLVRAWDNGANTERVVDMLRVGDEVRAIYRAALICDSPTPLAYYLAWPESGRARKLYAEDPVDD